MAIPPTNEFLDSLFSSMILPYTLHPVRVTDHPKNLIEFLTNSTSKEAICGNLLSAISDHLHQYLIIFRTLLHSNPISTKEVSQILIKKKNYIRLMLKE